MLSVLSSFSKLYTILTNLDDDDDDNSSKRKETKNEGKGKLSSVLSIQEEDNFLLCVVRLRGKKIKLNLNEKDNQTTGPLQFILSFWK